MKTSHTSKDAPTIKSYGAHDSIWLDSQTFCFRSLDFCCIEHKLGVCGKKLERNTVNLGFAQAKIMKMP